MGRISVLALILCAGCAGSDAYVYQDGVWGDLTSLFSRARPYAPSSPVSSPAFYPDMVAATPAGTPPSAAPNPAKGQP